MMSMFKSGREYKGLDDYFYTMIEQDHLRNDKRIKERVAQIESLYEEWSYDPFWKHTEDTDANNWKNAFCKQAIDLMAESANCYILGFFKASVVASSAAVEQLIHVDAQGEQIRRQRADHSEYLITRYDTLSALLPLAKQKGYPIDALLDPGEVDLPTCIFVQRRNIVAHGAYENEFVIEQMHYINIIDTLEDKSNADYPYFNATSAFDQYKKASKFVIAAFGWFNRERRSPSASNASSPSWITRSLLYN